VLETEAFTEELPTNNEELFAITLAPTETAIVFTVEIPAFKPIGDILAVAELFAIFNKEELATAFTVELPTVNPLVVTETFAPALKNPLDIADRPIVKLDEFKLADPEELANCNNVEVRTEFVLELPT
jgi:hypothetical protein